MNTTHDQPRDGNSGAGWASNHDHVFGQDRATSNETRTFIVVLLTALTMAVEVTAGLVYGSMALLADGVHMASHAVALGIATFAYRYARRHAADRSFSFGTGKVTALAGYSGAVLLGVFALGMAFESFGRLAHPTPIAVNGALLVAVLGLLVNGVSVAILGVHADAPAEADANDHHHHDHNLRSAYLHVLADAVTSVLAIAALLAAKYAGLTWLDPVIGVLGALLVARWSVGLLAQSARVLLDRQAPLHVLEDIRAELEKLPGTRVADLHVWSIGVGKRAAIVCIEAEAPCEPDVYRERLPRCFDLAHVTIEVCPRGCLAGRPSQ